MHLVDLAPAAEDDLDQIWQYTFEKWGFDQAETYFDLIVACCQAVGAGEATPKRVNGLPGHILVHRCEHHYIFVLIETARPIILAILHGRMDFVARLQERLPKL